MGRITMVFHSTCLPLRQLDDPSYTLLEEGKSTREAFVSNGLTAWVAIIIKKKRFHSGGP